jgi:hypothetical protein
MSSTVEEIAHAGPSRPSDADPVQSPIHRRGGAVSTSRTILGFVAVLAFILAVDLVAFGRHGRGSAPPVPGDTQDYENIAWNLLQGRGFGHDWDDPAWRAVRRGLGHASRDVRRHLARRGGSRRPRTALPALPFAIAATYAVLGRSFLAWGIVHAAIAAAGLALACALAMRLAGAGAAGLALLLGLLDSNLRGAAVLAPYLSEGLGCLAVVLLVWALVLLAERPVPARFAAAGAALGILPLVRGIFVFWYAPIGLCVLWTALRGARKGIETRRFALGAALFLAAALVVPLPWWIRNCAVLDGFLPLGTQGGRNLPLGYSDLAVAAGGVWTPEGTGRWWSEHETRFAGLPPLELEREQARFGQREATLWIRTHPAAAAGLAVRKAVDLWKQPLPGRFGLPLALCALLALAPARSRRGLGALWAVLAAETFAVSATYGDGARFLVPVLPILHVLVANGL